MGFGKCMQFEDCANVGKGTAVIMRLKKQITRM
jgi:hypothetical protein